MEEIQNNELPAWSSGLRQQPPVQVPQQEAQSPKKKRGLRRFLFIALIILVPILAYGAYTANAAYKAMTNARAGQAAALTALERAKMYDIAGALKDAGEARAYFASAHRYLLSLAPYQAIPTYGAALNAATAISGDVANITENVLTIAEEARNALGANADPLFNGNATASDLSSLFHELSSEDKAQVLAVLAKSAGKIEGITRRLDRIAEKAPQLSVPDLTWPTSISFADFRENVPLLVAKTTETAQQLRAVAPIMEMVPNILGFPNGKKYLLLFANNTELRPTGGFLGVIGVAYLRAGDLANLDVRDVYAYDGALLKTKRPPAPQPFAEYINVKEWFLRDANWSPDFAESVRTIEQFYLEAQRAENADAAVPDAYIQFDPVPIAQLMKVTGPITVSGKTFTSENLVEELEFQVEFGFVDTGTHYDDRKQIVVDLANAFMERMKSLSVTQLLAAIAIIEQAFQEKHISIYSHDPILQQMVREQEWGGTLLPVQGDYIAVVDANLGALKSDPKVKRTISYTITPDATRGYIGKVAITYKHEGVFDKFTSRYRTYTRLYVPAGSTFLSAKGTLKNDKHFNPKLLPGHVDVVEELGRVSFGAFTSIEPQRTGTLEFTFALAPSVVDMIRRKEYQLDVEKQKGTSAHGLTLNLDFGSLLRTAAPPENPTNFGDSRYTFTTDLLLNRHFNVGLR